MFEHMNDLEIVNEYKKEKEIPSIYLIALATVVMEVLYRYFFGAFIASLCLLGLLIILIVIRSKEKNKIEKDELLKKEILKRMGVDNYCQTHKAKL